MLYVLSPPLLVFRPAAVPMRDSGSCAFPLQVLSFYSRPVPPRHHPHAAADYRDCLGVLYCSALRFVLFRPATPTLYRDVGIPYGYYAPRSGCSVIQQKNYIYIYSIGRYSSCKRWEKYVKTRERVWYIYIYVCVWIDWSRMLGDSQNFKISKFLL